MKVSRRDLARMVAKKAAVKQPSRAWLTALAAYLLQTNRVSELAPMLRDVRREWAASGRLDVTATSAHPLSPPAKQDIRAAAKHLYPRAKQLVITPTIDPSLIGGVKLDIVDYEIDISVRRRLERFRAGVLGSQE